MQTMSRYGALFILIVVLAFAAVAAARANPLAPQSASGKSPRDALDVGCNWAYLPALSSAWYRLTGRNGNSLRVSLVSYPETLEQMTFQVYAVDGEPERTSSLDLIGRGHVGDTRIAQDWAGNAEPGATYLVNVLNYSAKEAGYSMCDSDP